MKKLIYLLVFSCSTIFSQGILEKLYYMLPNEKCDNFSLTERKEMMVRIKNNESGSQFDERNGYLIDNFSTQGSVEMCYWKWQYPSDSTTAPYIVGVRENSGEPACDYTQFLIEKEGRLIRFIPEPLEYFNAAYFFKDDLLLSKIKPYLTYFWFELPAKGTSVVIHFGYGGLGAGMDENPAFTQKKNLKGDKIDLIWNKGDFKLGEPYF